MLHDGKRDAAYTLLLLKFATVSCLLSTGWWELKDNAAGWLPKVKELIQRISIDWL